NYAALVVNTRLYPDHKTGDDSEYYCKGLASQDQPHSLFGDIDVRKVWFTIDTSMMDPSSRTTYYVVRDLWHRDSTWLVKNDSAFAIYLKPGDAKFLYFEKGIAIRMAKGAATEEAEYAFNNGRRVAEIKNGTRTIGTYVRDGKLYVSYPRKGTTIEGYNEHSAGDNIATGHEVLLDSTGTNSRPSISAGMNDQSVAIVYWNSADSGRIKVAYQKHPDSGWMFTRYMGHPFQDTTGSDHSEVTPVITPYAEGTGYGDYSNGSDSIWWVAAGYQGITGNAFNPQGIAALRLRIFADSISFIADNPMQYFYKNLTSNASRDASAFPTITSRPLPNTKYPVRLAWQNYGKILYNTFKDVSGVITGNPAYPYIVSNGLPSLCYNRHPSIAMHSLRYPDANIGIGTGIGCGCCCTPPPQGKTPSIQSTGAQAGTYKEYDEIAWEAKLFNNGQWITNNNYWPILRQRIEYLEVFKQGMWSPFRVFKPYIDSAYYHYPIVNAASRSDTNENNKTKLKNKPVYYDDIRVAWQDKSTGILDFASWVYNWKRTYLSEGGTHPSLPQSTYSILLMTDSTNVPSSVGFAGLQTDSGKQQVRVTNGWLPLIATPLNVHLYPSIQLHLPQTVALFDCQAPKAKDNYGGIIIVRGGGVYKTVDWLSYSPEPIAPITMIGLPVDTLPADTLNRVAFYSDSMTLVAGDSIILARKTDSLNLTSIRTALADSSDYIMIRTTLRKIIDTSYVGTIDSSVITKSVAIYPGNGLDASFARYKYPSGSPTDSVFVLVEVRRGNLNDSLDWSAMETNIDTAIPMQSFKNIASPPPLAEVKPPYLFVDVVPNPFNQSTTLKIKSAEGVPTHVEVFDLLGKRIADLYNQSFPSSPIEIRFEAAMLSAGSYYVRIQSGDEVVTKNIQLIK
ncbi:MAG: T9SS type A sorting domain-containing protein, partial [Bacteroidota bacterium]|nr:T9SS type A sorting domain-containing protein [Bacteroidota bacterium]